MPVVIIEMYPGRTPEQKRALVKAVTEAMVEHAGARPDHLHVILHEVAPENWALAGRLGTERDSVSDLPGGGGNAPSTQEEGGG
ncbi:MAG: 2-hydroxymuconate tautomerase family protein [Thermogemmatispora sp.]|uniref:2-hydroxymuconate tautomerase n=1 Tax=Thermogemmatispora sp. TaxID=1968838 RepID=UPI0026287C88|nr:2-hydroxymuconate tautomerase [Thermogemmatispora sp.]MBX5457375.1 2-hydroxymuconate tautomerase family protein [Thermogemmatispora sp.]